MEAMINRKEGRWFARLALSILLIAAVLAVYPCKALAVTGEDVAKIALGEVDNGYYKYTSWMGPIGDGNYVYQWCATFTSWCGWTSGALSEGITPKDRKCENQMAWFKSAPANKALWYDGYTDYEPKEGDFIFFTGGQEKAGETHHVGIVVGASGDWVTVIEGNSGQNG